MSKQVQRKLVGLDQYISALTKGEVLTRGGIITVDEDKAIAHLDTLSYIDKLGAVCPCFVEVASEQDFEEVPAEVEEGDAESTEAAPEKKPTRVRRPAKAADTGTGADTEQ